VAAARTIELAEDALKRTEKMAVADRAAGP
jgi:hypothetical protein